MEARDVDLTVEPGTDAVRAEARKQLQKRRDFAGHVVAYLVVNAMLVGIWAVSGAGYFWPIWVILGWGVGVVLNAWDVFLRRPITEADIDREVARMRSRGQDEGGAAGGA